ncbi:hypothetical protein [Kitasatospora sp. NRRL B-11411]|nr:hypothetical protein [Kitasatospora sp. NRRL B-11411]
MKKLGLILAAAAALAAIAVAGTAPAAETTVAMKNCPTCPIG